jgi:hypothetical protein
MKIEITLSTGEKVTRTAQTIKEFIALISPNKIGCANWTQADDGSFFEYRHVVKIREIK